MAKNNSNNNVAVTSPKSGKQYKAGDTVKGSKTGNEYKVQADGTMTCNGKTYVFNEQGNITLKDKGTNGKNGSGSGNGSGGGSRNGSGGSSGNGSSGSSSIAQDLKTFQNLGGSNASEIYKNAKARGMSTEEASRLAGTFGRLNSAAGADSSTLYQYGVTQSDINKFNIVRGNSIANAAISTGTYTFNTKTYANVTKELATSATASKTMVADIDRAISNTDTSSTEYQQLVDMRERMYQVNQSTNFVRNRLEDAYNATKAADESVQRIVMNVQTDSLQIKVGKTLAYDSSNSAISREGDSSKWSHYVNTRIVAAGGVNNSTVQSLQEVKQLEGTNLNTVSDILSAYDRSRNLESCTTMKDKVIYARNNEDGLKQVALSYKEQGFSEEHWKKFLDTYYVTDKNGNRKESTVTDDVYKSYVDYYNNLNLETKTATVDDYKAASNETNEVLRNINGVTNNFNTTDGTITVKVQGASLNVTENNTKYQIVSDAEYAANRDKYAGKPVISQTQFDKMVSIMVHEQSNKSDEYLAIATVFVNNLETSTLNVRSNGTSGTWMSCNYNADLWFESACKPHDQNGQLYTSATTDANGNYTGKSAEAAAALKDVLNGKRVFNANVLYWRGNGTDNTFGTYWAGSGAWSTANI